MWANGSQPYAVFAPIWPRWALTCVGLFFYLFAARRAAQDAFGNYVVQYVLELGHQEACARVLSVLKGHFPELAVQKFSSNVVERCLKLGGMVRLPLRACMHACRGGHACRAMHACMVSICMDACSRGGEGAVPKMHGSTRQLVLWVGRPPLSLPSDLQ